MIKLFELRTEKGLSQREAARILKISQGTYNNWENGKTQPSIEQLITLSAFFEVSVDYIIGNTDDYGGIVVKDTRREEEESVLRFYRNLKPEAKRALLTLLKHI